jgi:hypothetical protein
MGVRVELVGGPRDGEVTEWDEADIQDGYLPIPEAESPSLVDDFIGLGRLPGVVSVTYRWDGAERWNGVRRFVRVKPGCAER